MIKQAPKRILFATYGGGHAQMVIPVVKALSGRADVTVLGLPSALGHLKKADIPALTFADLIDPELDSDALLWGEMLAEEHHSDDSGIDRKQSVAYLGLSFADLVGQSNYNEAIEQVRFRGRHAFLPIGVLERVMELCQPHIVITTSSPRAEAAALYAAKSRGIPTLAMVDLFSGIPGYVLPSDDASFLTQTAVELTSEQGFLDPDLTRPHVLGNPAFDRLLHRHMNKGPRLIAEHFPQVTGKRLILHADMPAWLDTLEGETHTKSPAETWSEMTLCATAAKEVGATYLVRPHPAQDRALYKEFTSGTENAFMADNIDLHDLIEQVDLVVARSTTVALEAVYLRQRVLQLEPQRHADMPLVKMGVAMGAHDLQHLAHTFKSCLEDSHAHHTRIGRIRSVLPQQPAATAIAELILSRTNVVPLLDETSI